MHLMGFRPPRSEEQSSDQNTAMWETKLVQGSFPSGMIPDWSAWHLDRLLVPGTTDADSELPEGRPLWRLQKADPTRRSTGAARRPTPRRCQKARPSSDAVRMQQSCQRATLSEGRTAPSSFDPPLKRPPASSTHLRNVPQAARHAHTIF